MKPVYADVLVALNILFTYVFLICTRVLGHCPSNKICVALASLLGGLSSLIIFYDEINVVESVLYKVFTASIIVSVAFLPRSFRRFVKTLVWFCSITVLFGGAMYFLEVAFGFSKIMYINGVVYFDMSIKYLIGCILFIYGIFMLCSYFLDRKAYANQMYNVSVNFRGVTVDLIGFTDTGNNLRDALTERYVSIGELSALSPLFTYEELTYFKENVSTEIPSSLRGVVRLIPATSIGGTHLLKAFNPDGIVIHRGGRSVNIKNTCIAIVNSDLSAGEYNLLLNKNILQ